LWLKIYTFDRRVVMICIVTTPVNYMVLAATLLLALSAAEGRAARAVGTTQPFSPEVVLPRLNAIDLTVSGLSSGAYMAVQMQVAHSASINGSAIFAGGPYYCAESDLRIAETRCMRNFRDHTGTSVARLVKYTNDASVVGTIDNTAHLKSARAYVFSGTLDTVVDSRYNSNRFIHHLPQPKLYPRPVPWPWR
jgi:hypothetical protein